MYIIHGIYISTLPLIKHEAVTHTKNAITTDTLSVHTTILTNIQQLKISHFYNNNTQPDRSLEDLNVHVQASNLQPKRNI